MVQVSTMLITAERRSFVLNLRKAGVTYMEIARLAIQEFGSDSLPKGWDERYAYKDVKRELERLRKDMAVDVEDIRELDLERLDVMLEAIWKKATGDKTDYDAMDRVLRIMERRDKLLGLGKAPPIDLGRLTVVYGGNIDPTQEL